MQDVNNTLAPGSASLVNSKDMAPVKVSFITWYPSCRRSDAIAAALGGPSHLIHYLGFKQPRYAALKYVAQTAVTWRRLWRDRSRCVLVASPPVVAALIVWLFCAVFRRQLVIDAHTGVFDDPRWTWALPLSRFLARRAVATIVTSEHLAREVERWGGRALVIGVVPVEFIDAAPAELGAGRHVAVINTFSQDEPLADILHAAAQCQRAGQDVTFHITGSLKHARSRLPDELPANVRFTGWLSEQDYASLLRGVDAVLCLTKHDHTMQRGGYEAMALGQPLITSHWGILRQAFCAGTVHVDNSPRQIAAAVAQVLDDTENPRLRAAMQELARQRSAEFRQRLQQLTTMIKKAL